MAGEPLAVRPGLVIPADEIEVAFARAGGPGGQNVNKVESKVVLRFRPLASRVLNDEARALVELQLGGRLTDAGEILIHAARYRDRGRNLEDARERLAELLREALRPRKTRHATKPTRGARRRRLETKRRRSDVKRGRRGED